MVTRKMSLPGNTKKVKAPAIFAEIGKPCRIDANLCPPKDARWRLIYWDFVVYFANHKDTEAYRDGGKWMGRGKNKVRVPNLSYHQREDCFIERQIQTKREKK